VKTHVNGEPKPWTPEIEALWARMVVPRLEGRVAWMANYFTPRPYRDEWNRATEDHGFVYCIGRECWETRERAAA
jgi:hypothetical protein